jgi:alkylation response protein AidB-like acyl-CoA dehydrogenase
VDFHFSPDEITFRQEVRDFIAKELPKELLSGEIDDFDMSMEFRRKLGKKKWIGIGWEKEYGGLGAGPVLQMIFHEEMVYHNAPLDPQAYQVGPAIIYHGSDYLKKTYLAATANQEIVWCQGFSEPDAGSDLASLATTAVKDGDEYVINGQKIWTTWAHRADQIHILTRSDPNAPKHRGISYFVLDMKTPGIQIRPLIDMTGGHHFNEVFFDNVRVPTKNMIGEENRGWYVAMTTLQNERSGIRDVARAARQLEDTFKALRDGAGIKGIRRDPVMMRKLSDLAVQVQVGRNLSYRVGWMQDRGLPIEEQAPMAKLFSSELQQRIAAVGMEMLGLYSQELGGSRHPFVHGGIPGSYMYGISGTIAAGSSEINRNVMATRGLGLPRG